MTNPFIRVGLATGIIRQHQSMPNGQSAAMAAVARAAASASAQQQSASNPGHAASAAGNPQGAVRPQAQPAAAPRAPQASAAPGAAAEQQQQQARHEAAPATSQAAPAQPQPHRSPAAQPTAAARASQPSASASLSTGTAGAMATPVRTDIMQAVEKGKDIDTVFPVEAKFKGELEIDQHFILKGVFRGSINQTGMHSLLIGNTGGVHGNVRAHQLIVGGTIEGDVCGNEVIVLETGRIIGNVAYEKLAIELGGEVNGRTQKEVFNVVVGQSPAAQPAEPAAAQPPASGNREVSPDDARRASEQAAPAFNGLHAVPTPQNPSYGSGGLSGEPNQGASPAYGQTPEECVA